MTNLLLSIFVPNHTEPEAPAVRSRVGMLSGVVGICVNLILFGFKLAVGLLSGSVSITADAMNNLSDASGSILTLVGFHLAGKPADEEHPYGHARFEYLSALAVAAMILLIGFELAQSSVTKMVNPTAVSLSFLTAVVLTASIAMKLWLCLFNRKLGILISSKTLQATAMDSRNDCVATLVVLIAAGLEQYADLRVDGIMGLAVAAFIFRSGWELARETISTLLGERPDPELRKRIVDYVEASPNVLGYHDLMVHDYGPGRQFASLHVEMDSQADPLFCHELIDDMERECLHSHGIHLVIHYDPVVTDDPELTRLKELVKEILKEFDSRISIHDFRMVKGGRNTNLIFDISLPPDLAKEEQTIRSLLQTRLNEDPGMYYHLVLTFDMAL